MAKILSLDTLARVLAEFREQGCRVVLANGCFDLLHAGHVAHLRAARRLGDLLCVTVTLDAHVNKGPGRPVFPLAQRCGMLAALDCVDYVTPNIPVAGEAIRLLKPAIYVKGAEFRNQMTEGLRLEKIAIEEVGGELIFPETAELHTSHIIQTIRS